MSGLRSGMSHQRHRVSFLGGFPVGNDTSAPVADGAVLAADGKAIQALRPSDCAWAFGRAEGVCDAALRHGDPGLKPRATSRAFNEASDEGIVAEGWYRFRWEGMA